MNIDVLNAKKVEFITIANDTGLEVTLSSYGASIYQIKLDLEEMTLTPKQFDTFYHNGKYYGLTIGRIAGRIKQGQLIVNDKVYQLEQNEGQNCLHGGFHSIAFENFKPQIINETDGVIVKFYLTSKKGEAGFNGKCKYVVSYKIHRDENILQVRYDAECKEDTYFNMTNHTYFNLTHSKDILSHRLRVKADEVSTFDMEDFTINGYVPVDNTVFDFREAKLIKKDIKNEALHSSKWLNGYDHRFHLNPVDKNEYNISLDYDNYKLEIYTDFDGVHVYTGGFSNHELLINDDLDDVFKGVALECCNIYPEFVKGKEKYTHKVKYVFRRKSDEF